MAKINNHGLKCKTCIYHNDLIVEQIDKDLFFAKCSNRDHSNGFYLTLSWIPKWSVVQVKQPDPKPKNMSSYDQQKFNKLQVPYWRMLGLKPTAKELAYDKWLKSRGMTYGDAVLERSMKGEYESALPKWEEHMK